MSLQRSRRRSDKKQEVRFKELAVLQQALLDQQAQIEALSLRGRGSAHIPPQTESGLSTEKKLAAALDRIAELECVQSDLANSVNEKELERFALATKLQDTFIFLEEIQNTMAVNSDFRASGMAELRESLRLQEIFLQEKKEALANIQNTRIQD